jgi:hypothetical protein
MANFAQLDENNKVINIIVISNDEILDENGQESEALGITKCREIVGEDTNWIQTSYNNSIRHRYAHVGGIYHPEHDAFSPKKPFDSWVLNTDNFNWEPPIGWPDTEPPEGKIYDWDEENTEWVLKDYVTPPDLQNLPTE